MATNHYIISPLCDFDSSSIALKAANLCRYSDRSGKQWHGNFSEVGAKLYPDLRRFEIANFEGILKDAGIQLESGPLRFLI